ncbi:MAG: Transrane secretion effector, partial [Marmoricola sp.]|nr:Transrane secretion effector [Marmoricola sp.]
MCAACGIATHVVEASPAGVGVPSVGVPGVGVPGVGVPSVGVPSVGVPGVGVPGVEGAAGRKFAALRNRDCRTYLVGGALAMMADNIEHV